MRPSMQGLGRMARLGRPVGFLGAFLAGLSGMGLAPSAPVRYPGRGLEGDAEALAGDWRRAVDGAGGEAGKVRES